ncbi:MAG TPA: ATP-dependent DNA helicase RecQ, partial [Propionibacteriaceae bacterium]|nr:ATP-dependent DNA helicase RecQ [Propionibacteriaceae bacterium]
ERILEVLADEPQSLVAVEAATGIRRGRLETVLKILAVDEAVERRAGGWVATGKPWYFDSAKWDALRKVRAAEADLMRAYAHGEGCLMQFLQQALDDPDRRPCGRCSVCTGELPLPGARPQQATVDAARRFFRGQDVVVEPRKQWAGRLPDRKGKITFMAPGRALAYADDPAWNTELATLWQADRPASSVILDGLVQVLVRWSKVWERPVAVVGMPSRRFPTLVGSLAGHVATVGRLPLVDALAVSGPPPSVDSASSVRATDLLYRTTLNPGVRFDGPVLLVDDTTRTRWTATVAGALLADAGATSVLPLVVHQLP